MSETWAQLGAVDLFALLLLLFNGVMGLIRGFTWQFVRLATIVAGLVLARLYADPVAAWFDRAFNVQQPADGALAWFAIFSCVFIAGTLLAHLLRRLLNALRLQSYDRLLGLLLGVVKGAAIVLVVVLLLARLEGVQPLQDALGRSHTAQLAGVVVERVGALFPASLRKEYEDWFERVRARLKEQRDELIRRLPAGADAPADDR